MKRFCVKETVNHYHMIEIDDELSIDDIVSLARQHLKDNTGFGAINQILSGIEHKYGFDYSVKPNYCGATAEALEVMGCDDDSPELD